MGARNGHRPTTWLGAYLDYTAHLESPTVFHQWCALAVVGHLLGRRIWLVRGGEYCIFPGQIMVVLVSPSAVVRKSTAIEAAVKLVRAVPHLVNILPKKTSPQQLLDALRPRDQDGVPLDDRDAVGLIVASELGAFFSAEGFLETMVTQVTALSDAPHGLIDPETLTPEDREERCEFRSWQVVLKNPCVGLIGATTPAGMANELPPQVRQTGFMGRVLWIVADSTDRAPNSLSEMRPLRPDPTALVGGLERMGALAGPVRFTRQGRELFDTWYAETYTPHIRTMDVDVVKESGYWGRKPDHVLRVAMTMAAMEGELILRERVIEQALQWLRPVERTLPGVLKSVGVQRKTTEVGERVLDYLSKRGESWVPLRVLLQRFWRIAGPKHEMLPVLETLVHAREIEQQGVGNAVAYRRAMRRGRALRSTQEAPDLPSDPPDVTTAPPTDSASARLESPVE